MRLRWVIIWTVTAIVVPFVLLATFVIVPSMTERRERCDAVGGVVIKGGTCVKKESVLGY